MVNFADFSSTPRPVKVKRSFTLRSTLRSGCSNDFTSFSRDIEAGHLTNVSQASHAPISRSPSLSVRERLTEVAAQLASLKPRRQTPLQDQTDEYAPGEILFENESYEEQPMGWPQLASFMDGCENFSIFRRFGQCHTRILVNYMVDITAIEKQLLDLDRVDIEPDGKLYRLRSHKRGSDTIKEDLLALLEEKLRKYSTKIVYSFINFS
ncbi:MAG: hypothetical protein Q9187_003321 [Circinaria calcarea]